MFFLTFLLHMQVIIQQKEMGCPALGVWVTLLKQPDALPGRALPKNK
jgi:hypothetical protein